MVNIEPAYSFRNSVSDATSSWATPSPLTSLVSAMSSSFGRARFPQPEFEFVSKPAALPWGFITHAPTSQARSQLVRFFKLHRYRENIAIYAPDRVKIGRFFQNGTAINILRREMMSEIVSSLGIFQVRGNCATADISIETSHGSILQLINTLDSVNKFPFIQLGDRAPNSIGARIASSGNGSLG